MKTYFKANVEAASQLINTLHGGHDPNETFSARCGRIRDGSGAFWILPRWYWWTIIWAFEVAWPGHLDWAIGPD